MLYDFIISVARIILKLIFKVEVSGIENIPKDKSFVVTPNHLSNFDPPIIAVFLPVKMGYMAKEELFKIPIVKSVIKAVGAFPVRRGKNDLSAIKTAITILKANRSIVIFPEGKRVFTPGILGEGKSGAALIALRAGVGFLPVGIDTQYKFRGKVKVNIGKYIDLAEYQDKKMTGADLQQITDEILMPEIAQLAGAKVYGN